MDAGDEATSQKGYAEWCRQVLMISDPSPGLLLVQLVVGRFEMRRQG